MPAVLELLNKQPLVGFALLVAVILIVPVFFERLAAGAVLWLARVEFPAVSPVSDSGRFGNGGCDSSGGAAAALFPGDAGRTLTPKADRHVMMPVYSNPFLSFENSCFNKPPRRQERQEKKRERVSQII